MPALRPISRKSLPLRGPYARCWRTGVKYATATLWDLSRFLAGLFQTGPILIAAIGPTAIRQFVLGNGAEWSAGTIRVVGGAIGGYLRFRALAGEAGQSSDGEPVGIARRGDRVTELLAAIPRAAHWRLASLPDVLSDAEIDELLRSFDPPFRSYRRAFAMVRCLTDLGLRCSEVARSAARRYQLERRHNSSRLEPKPAASISSRCLSRPAARSLPICVTSGLEH